MFSTSGADAGLPGERRVRVGVRSDFFPYSYVDKDSKVQGFSVDLMRALAQRMHLRLELVPVESAGLQALFEQGSVDILLHLSSAELGQVALARSTPILVQQGVLFVRKGDRRFRGLEDLVRTGARFAAAPVGVDYAKAGGAQEAQILRVGPREALLRLVRGEVEAALLSRLTGMAEAADLGLSSVEPLEQPLQGYTVRYGLGLRPGDDELLGIVNEGIASLFQTGDMDRLRAEHFANFEPRRFSLAEVLTYASALLALALLLTLWALARQREMRRRIQGQARDLEESGRLLAEAQRVARLGHWRWDPSSGQPLLCSRELLRLVEFPEGCSLLGFQELCRLALPEDRLLWMAATERLLTQGLAYELELSVWLASGRAKRLQASGQALSGGGYFGTLQDITERRETQEALQRSERLLRALYDTLPLGLGVVAREKETWLVVSLNPEFCRLVGILPPSSAPLPFAQLGLNPAERGEWLQWFDRALVERRPFLVEEPRNHRKRHYAITLVALDHEQEGARVCFVVEDQTERKLKDAEISEGRRLRAVGELVGGIAHEFNNLLTPILLTADVLRLDWKHHPALVESLKPLSEAAQRGAELTRRLLTLGRRTEQSLAWLRLRPLVEADLALLRQTFDRRILIRNTVPEDLPEFFAPEGDLHQVILNLLLNARDALEGKLARPPTQEWKASIRIAASLHPAEAWVSPLSASARPKPEGWLCLSVSDNGCGMSEEVLERLFEPFFTTKEVGRGTGLGLATAWHLVAGFGGRIEVQSNLGEGSCFGLCIPLEPRPASAVRAQTPTSELKEGALPVGQRILVADDEPAILRLVAELLRRKGFVVTTAADGTEAWNELSRNLSGFSVLLVDLNMPGLSGQEFLRRARQSGYAGLALAMSGRVSEEDMQLLRAAGVGGIVEKPFTSNVFMDRLHEALRGAGVLAS